MKHSKDLDPLMGEILYQLLWQILNIPLSQLVSRISEAPTRTTELLPRGDKTYETRVLILMVAESGLDLPRICSTQVKC